MVACALLMPGQIHQQHEGVTVIADHVNQFSESNTIDVNDNAPHVQCLHVNAVGFQRQGQFHCFAPGCLPRVMLFTVL